MIIRKKKETVRVIGRGYVKCKCGGNILDILKPLINPAIEIIKNKDLAKDIGKTALNVFQIGKNTKTIVDNIRNKRKNVVSPEDDNDFLAKQILDNRDLESVINRIKQIRIGSGFKII